VLITSRNALWPPKQAVEVPVLDADVAAGLLVGRAGDPDERTARALAGELGGLPLALEQAAAYAQATGNSLAAYLALLRQRRGDLLARGPVSGYGGTVATTWALAFGQLQDSAPGAAGLLRLLACCAPEPVPLRLLLRPPPERSGQLDPEVAQVLKPLLDDELAAGTRAAVTWYGADGRVVSARCWFREILNFVTVALLPLSAGWCGWSLPGPACELSLTGGAGYLAAGVRRERAGTVEYLPRLAQRVFRRAEQPAGDGDVGAGGRHHGVIEDQEHH
jgi:hypothetical protein